MNSPKHYSNKLKISLYLLHSNPNIMNNKLFSVILLKLYLSLRSKNLNKPLTNLMYIKSLSHIYLPTPTKNLPNLEGSLNYISSISNVKTLNAAYFSLFNFFYKFGEKNRKIFFFDSNGYLKQATSIINWVFFLNSNYRSVKLENLTYKSFYKKKYIKRLPSNIECVIILPSTSSRLKRMIRSIKTPYIAYVDKDYSHRGNNYIPEVLPKHILMLSHLFFFYKKGLIAYNKRKLYKLMILLLS